MVPLFLWCGQKKYAHCFIFIYFLGSEKKEDKLDLVGCMLCWQRTTVVYCLCCRVLRGWGASMWREWICWGSKSWKGWTIWRLRRTRGRLRAWSRRWWWLLSPWRPPPPRSQGWGSPSSSLSSFFLLMGQSVVSLINLFPSQFLMRFALLTSVRVKIAPPL